MNWKACVVATPSGGGNDTETPGSEAPGHTVGKTARPLLVVEAGTRMYEYEYDSSSSRKHGE